MNGVKVLKNEDLSKYTTVRIGGCASKMFFPVSIEELSELRKTYPDARVLGGGSNLLIANKIFDVVINLRDMALGIIRDQNNIYQVGASVRNQELIKTINEDGYGGIEYLFSVPGLVGGAIVMNAGNGLEKGDCISDCLISVKAINKNGELCKFSKSECNFSHRNSIFKNNEEYIVVGAEFAFEQMSKEEAVRRRKERLEFCKKTQDSSRPNFGSVFSNYNFKIMNCVSKLKLGKGGGIHFSEKTVNWIVNPNRDNDFVTAIKLINYIRKIHMLFGKKCDIEVIIWK